MDDPINDSIPHHVLNLAELKKLLASSRVVSDRINELYKQTDVNAFTMDYESIRSAFYSSEISNEL